MGRVRPIWQKMLMPEEKSDLLRVEPETMKAALDRCLSDLEKNQGSLGHTKRRLSERKAQLDDEQGKLGTNSPP
jgi:tRNA(Phe) wybutosine-synthesizing methylase Tyw3